LLVLVEEFRFGQANYFRNQCHETITGAFRAGLHLGKIAFADVVAPATELCEQPALFLAALVQDVEEFSSDHGECSFFPP
jgi:hypothetical protein